MYAFIVILTLTLKYFKQNKLLFVIDAILFVAYKLLAILLTNKCPVTNENCLRVEQVKLFRTIVMYRPPWLNTNECNIK